MTKTSFLFSAVGTAPILSFLSPSVLCDVDGAEATERKRGEASRGRDRNSRNDDNKMWRTSQPNPHASDSPLQTSLRHHRCVRATITPGAWSATPPSRDGTRIYVGRAAGGGTGRRGRRGPWRGVGTVMRVALLCQRLPLYHQPVRCLSRPCQRAPAPLRAGHPSPPARGAHQGDRCAGTGR